MKELLNMTIEKMIKEMCKDGEITIEDIKDEYEYERRSQSACPTGIDGAAGRVSPLFCKRRSRSAKRYADDRFCFFDADGCGNDGICIGIWKTIAEIYNEYLRRGKKSTEGYTCSISRRFLIKHFVLRTQIRKEKWFKNPDLE